jgi:hypothetical protein
MKKILSSHLLCGFLLAGSSVVADEASQIATDSLLIANPRHASAMPLAASATDAVSATTSNFNLTHGGPPTNALPPLPPGVTELKFGEFFRQPIGPRGLESSEKLRSLDGGRIRILGYMVRQTKPVEHCFLLAARPLIVNEVEYGLADDLPATTLHVFTHSNAPVVTPFTPGPLLLTGKLSVGNRAEADGRVSTVRLFLDPPSPEQQLAAKKAAEAAAQSARPHAGHQH